MLRTEWKIDNDEQLDIVSWGDLKPGDLFTITEKNNSLYNKVLMFVLFHNRRPCSSGESQEIFLEIGENGKITEHDWASRNTKLRRLAGTVTVKLNA